VGLLDHDARTVAGVFLSAARAAMVEIPQDGQAVQDELMAFAAGEVYENADTAAAARNVNGRQSPPSPTRSFVRSMHAMIHPLNAWVTLRPCPFERLRIVETAAATVKRKPGL
jgi:hypothetical protein